MKEVTIQDIRKIEDAELRWLTRYEHLIAWGKSGGVKRAVAAFKAQIAAAEQAKAVAELRVAQIAVIEQAVARFDARALRNAQMAAIAAKHRADAAERQAIQAACDEIMALEEIVPADDIDDILATVSAALGIDLPTEADRADICQRGPKSMADVKRELGPTTLKNYATDLTTTAVEWVEPQRGHVSTAQEVEEQVKRPASFPSRDAAYQWLLENVYVFEASTFDWLDRNYPEPDDALDEEALDAAYNEPLLPLHRLKCAQPIAPAPWNEKLSKIELWALSHFDHLTDDVWEWMAENKDKPEWADDALDDEALDAACSIVSHPFDAGKTLEQLGWSPPPYDPPKPPDSIVSWEQAIMRMAS